MMLVDSTVYIALLRQRQDPRAALAHLLRSGALRAHCETTKPGRCVLQDSWLRAPYEK